MLKVRNVVILLVVFLVVMSVGMQVKATNLTLDLTNLSSGDTTNETADANTTTNEATLNITTNEEDTEVVQPVTNTSNDTSSGNDLPQTGVTEDITVMFFIVVCVISAIYAYKKIRDYKA